MNVLTLDPADFQFTRRAWVDASPLEVYRLVSDVSSISRWSPNASDVAFDEDSGPVVGAWFSGRNRRGEKEWVSRSQVVRAEPGAAFAFVVGGADDGIVEWSWTFHPHGRGCVAEQSWRLLRMDPVLGGDAAEVTALRDYMAASAEATLTSLAEWIAVRGSSRR
ncbi:SRPBCC family protein [Lentzea guizhouensis]|uniref:SRPBCC family protein n=1 Tax=Lentzea guizhouensis TaxID=1586287 RepID=UPI001F2E06E3|nr:SRPBCC family protein [Lentzea guizhouensis]